MKIYRKNLVLACGVLFFAASCSRNESVQEETTKTEEVTTPEISNLAPEIQYKTLNDSLQGNWQRMSESDERKMASIKRLLDEISYTPRYNAIKQRQLANMHQRVKAMKFDLAGMNNSENIDRYDFAQDSLVNNTINLAAETPEAEKYPLINELTNDIQEEHNKTILFRIRHDESARAINQLLQQHENTLSKKVEGARKVPLFSLSGV